MTSSPTSTARRRAATIAVAVLALLAVLVGTFDWNWLRPAIRHYVLSHSGRRFDFEQMAVHVDGRFDPTVEFRGLEVQNAPWADARPLIRAGRVAATFAWLSLFSGQTVVELLVIEDAQVDMERQADGLRNWRLAHPDDRGPPKVRIVALDARRSQLRTVHRGIAVEANLAIAPLPAAEVLPGHPELPLTKRLTFSGTYAGKAFEGATAVSDRLTFGVTPERFALRGTARLGALRLAAQGLASDAHTMGDTDLDATLHAEGGGALWPLPPSLAAVTPLAARAHVSKAGTAWTIAGLHAQMGRGTAFAGEGGFVDDTEDGHRRTLRATLHDVVIDTSDVAALRSHPHGAATTAAPAQRALSTADIDTSALRRFDADLDLRDARFVGAADGLAQSLRLRATLARGKLVVPSFDLGLAGGHASGSAQLDASASPASAALDVRARGIDLARLSPGLARDGGIAGLLNGHAALQARGDSPAALARSAGGSLAASLGPGASVSRRLDAKLSLDGGEWLRSLFGGTQRVPVDCAELWLDVAHGRAVARRFAFETAHTALVGRGGANLADESIDALVMPVRKQRALLSLDRSVHVAGPWRDVKVALAPTIDDPVPGGCAVAPPRAR